MTADNEHPSIVSGALDTTILSTTAPDEGADIPTDEPMGITSKMVNISLDTIVGTSGDGPRCSEGPKTVEDTPLTSGNRRDLGMTR